MTIPNDVYLLSASSRFSLVQWDGFTVLRCRDQRCADGVTVYAYDCNSTKHRLEKEAHAYLKYALGIVKQNGRKRPRVLNKEETQTANVKVAVSWFKSECSKLGIEVREGHRGTIIGSNEFRDCDCVILSYGVFTSVANVALKQSLVEGQEIEGKRLFETRLIDGKTVKQTK